MSLLSGNNFSIVTKLTPAQVQVKLDEMLGLQSYQFSGYAADGIFKLQPINTDQKSYVPQIEGIVEAIDVGSRIHIRIRMTKTISIILIIGVILLLMAAALGVIDLLITKKGHPTFFPWLMLILIYIPLLSRFHAESKKAKETLVNRFQGEEGLF